MTVDYHGRPDCERFNVMKTRIEIAEVLARVAKAHASREGITLQELCERGLRMAMRADRENDRFVLRDASVGGHGLEPEFQGADWARVRAAIYEGRGG
ncbi:MAG: DUF2191 domain-containing protein [Holophagales bacterium]|nr:DUF2191 domain-containing protein [Holophagales bacterium]